MLYVISHQYARSMEARMEARMESLQGTGKQALDVRGERGK